MSSIDPMSTSLFFAASAEASRAASKNRQKPVQPDGVSSRKKLFSALLGEAEVASDFVAEGIPPEVAKMSFEEATTYLLDAVNVAGDILKKDGSMESIAEYRKAVSGFMHFVVKNSYEIEQHETRPTPDTLRGKRKRHKFTQIEVIDKKLDQLASDVLYNHADKLKILARVDEINGILVNLIT